jgi:hypothetical protein
MAKIDDFDRINASFGRFKSFINTFMPSALQRLNALINKLG